MSTPIHEGEPAQPQPAETSGGPGSEVLPAELLQADPGILVNHVDLAVPYSDHDTIDL